MGTGARDPSKDLDNLLTTYPQALWSDGVTLWATGAGDDDVEDDLYAYDLATRTRQPAKDFVDLRYHSTWEGRDEPLVPVSLWSDGITMWMANGVPLRGYGAGIFAYDLATRTPDPSRTISGQELTPAAMPRGSRGMASDGAILWVAEGRELMAFDLATRSRDHPRDFALVRRTPELDVIDSLETVDIWTDGTTMWVLERKVFEGSMRLHPFEVATGRSLGPWPDLELGFREHYTGMWSDGTTMWLSVEDLSARTPHDDLHAFNLAARSRDPGRDIVLRRGELGLRIGSMWSDGITIWVEEEASAGPLYLAVGVRAYNLETGARDPGKDVLHRLGEGPNGVQSTRASHDRGIWSDGATMWVARRIGEQPALDLIAFDLERGRHLTDDLVVGPLSLDNETLAVDESFVLSVTVRNQGAGVAASTGVRLYRSPSVTNWASPDNVVGAGFVPSLGPNGTWVVTFNQVAPSAPGTYYYGVCVVGVVTLAVNHS